MKMLLISLLALSSLIAKAGPMEQEEQARDAKPEQAINLEQNDVDRDCSESMVTDAQRAKYGDSSIVEGDVFRVVIHSTQNTAEFATVLNCQKVKLIGVDDNITEQLRKNLGLTRIIVGGWDESSQDPIFNVYHIYNPADSASER